MKRALGIVLAGLAVFGQARAQAQVTSPKNGVIAPKTNIDPGMKVLPPRTATRMPVVRPPGSPRVDRHKRVVVVPK